MEKQWLGIDQYGHAHTWYGQYCRRSMLEKFCVKHCSKMYEGEGTHVGYIVCGLWLRVFECVPLKNDK